MTQYSPSWLKWHVPAAGFMLCLLALPGARHFFEASMTRHMLLQFPLVSLAGFALADSLPRSWLGLANRWNSHGISGLFAAALLLAILMVPRLLDLALVDVRIELGKWVALLVCGAAVRLSWQPAGLVVQGFFLGNVLPIMAVVGYLFDSSPVRVCNAYLLDDQEGLGQKLVWTAAAIGFAWFASIIRTMMRDEEATAVSRLPSDEGPQAS
jgi:hypothetical protein